MYLVDSIVVSQHGERGHNYAVKMKTVKWRALIVKRSRAVRAIQ